MTALVFVSISDDAARAQSVTALVFANISDDATPAQNVTVVQFANISDDATPAKSVTVVQFANISDDAARAQSVVRQNCNILDSAMSAANAMLKEGNTARRVSVRVATKPSQSASSTK